MLRKIMDLVVLAAQTVRSVRESKELYVQSLVEEVKGLEQDVLYLEEELTAKNERIKELEQEVSYLNGRVDPFGGW